MKRLLLLTTMFLGLVFSAYAISFSLDSIATWGKFPKFCIDTYYWGDRFFNGYDTTYVTGAGYKFNTKFKLNSWIDYYNFDLPDNMRMRMLSHPSTSAGIWLTYLAVSVGYDKNLNKFFGGAENAKQQFTFGFNCSLFSCNIYYINNHSETRISKFGERGNTYNPRVDFNGAHSTNFGLDLYYFFNHKKYSQAAAFSFSRIQKKSQGSLFAGFSYSNNNYEFDFSQLPSYMKKYFPQSWIDDIYSSTSKNYSIKFGYGYNWVFAKNWALCFSESPSVGLKKGYISNPNKTKDSFALANQFRASLVWNNGRWFAGAIGEVNADIIYDKDSTFENAQISFNCLVGYRFNLW